MSAQKTLIDKDRQEFNVFKERLKRNLEDATKKLKQTSLNYEALEKQHSLLLERHQLLIQERNMLEQELNASSTR